MRYPHTHHANTPRHATPRYARIPRISWKPGRFLGTPDPVNKTLLRVPARLTSPPPPSRSMVSETLVIANVNSKRFIRTLKN
ncbi:Uncharacterized protein DBV15_11083 [Temnothorax longispinosus]|uniref:Uncharacterized protein n=1 Tax=Temnothorax longispinosus TaxID=300112 RepID=A0A4S2KXM9_9HYME|nr:Uncharacterized protein DBV15_11083 [Temnothorax longispinosus]